MTRGFYVWRPDCYSIDCEVWESRASAKRWRIRREEARDREDMTTVSFVPALLVLLHYVTADFIWQTPCQLTSYTYTVLPVPKNVIIDSYNLNAVLKWDPVTVENNSHPITYTVEYREYTDAHSLYLETNYDALCSKTLATQCDLPSYMNDWRVVLRIRAEMGNQKSNWTEIPKMPISKITVFGSVKSLSLNTNEEQNSLYVQFEPHVASSNYWSFDYKITYWKQGTNQKESLNWSKIALQLIKGLEPGTMYCVEVTAKARSIIGQVSDAVCERTADPALSTAGYIILFVCIVVVFSTALSISILVYKHQAVLKRWLYPPIKIPLHIEQYLLDIPLNSPVAKSTTKCVIDCTFDHLSIIEFSTSNIDSQTCTEEKT